MATRVSQLWRRRTPPSPRHLWAITTTSSADGVTAHVQVEFTLDDQGVETDPDALDRRAMGAVESLLRHEIAHRPVAELPLAGAGVDWVPPDLVPGASIRDVFVISSDVEVTHELRRLVTHPPGP